MLQVARFNSTSQFENPLITSVQGNSGGFEYGNKQKTNRVCENCNHFNSVSPLSCGYEWRYRQEQVLALIQLGGVGIEDLVLDLSNSTTMVGIFLERTRYGSWIKDVKVKGASNYSVHLMDCLQCEVRDSYWTS